MKKILTFGLTLCLTAPAFASEYEQAKQMQQLQQQQAAADQRFAALFEKLQATPKDAALHVAIGKLYFEKEFFELAQVSYQRALEFQPTSTDAYVALSDLFRKQNRKKEALSQLEKAVAQSPDQTELQYRLGVWLMEPETFDYKRAKKQYEQLKKANSPWAEKLGALVL